MALMVLAKISLSKVGIKAPRIFDRPELIAIAAGLGTKSSFSISFNARVFGDTFSGNCTRDTVATETFAASATSRNLYADLY